MNSLVDSGLKIKFLHEFPFSCYNQFPFMYKDNNGLWYIDKTKVKAPEIPLTFSIMAQKI